MSDPTMVGRLRIDGVVDGGARFGPEEALLSTTPEMWAAHRTCSTRTGCSPSPWAATWCGATARC